MVDIYNDEEFEQWQKMERLLFNDGQKGLYNIQYYKHIFAVPEVYFVSKEDFYNLIKNKDIRETVNYLRENYQDLGN